MRSMHIDYIKQGKEDLSVNFSLSEERLLEIKNRLLESQQCLEILEVEVRNIKGDLISIAKLEWQLKGWEKLKGY